MVTLVGLDPGSLYHFRVRSADASSNTALSADYTLTTRSITFTGIKRIRHGWFCLQRVPSG